MYIQNVMSMAQFPETESNVAKYTLKDSKNVILLGQ